MKSYAEINVRGRVDPQWSEYLSGMEISTSELDGALVTNLRGNLFDQAALFGVLNGLYGLGYPLLSVMVSMEAKAQRALSE